MRKLKSGFENRFARSLARTVDKLIDVKNRKCK